MAVALAAELVGIAQRAMEMAVEYAKERQQFGRPIGAYQAVSHRCAEMLYDIEEARSLTYYAAWAADAEPESLPLAAAMAKARASDAAWRSPQGAIQVHGGIGFTWEHDLHFLLKRARVGARAARRPPAMHRERVAAAGRASRRRATVAGVSPAGPRGRRPASTWPPSAVLDVHDLVLPVGADEPEPASQPADAPSFASLTIGRVKTIVRAAIRSRSPSILLDAVDVDADRPLGAARQPHPAADGHAALRDLELRPAVAHASSASATASKASRRRSARAAPCG